MNCYRVPKVSGGALWDTLSKPVHCYTLHDSWAKTSTPLDLRLSTVKHGPVPLLPDRDRDDGTCLSSTRSFVSHGRRRGMIQTVNWVVYRFLNIYKWVQNNKLTWLEWLWKRTTYLPHRQKPFPSHWTGELLKPGTNGSVDPDEDEDHVSRCKTWTVEILRERGDRILENPSSLLQTHRLRR